MVTVVSWVCGQIYGPEGIDCIFQLLKGFRISWQNAKLILRTHSKIKKNLTNDSSELLCLFYKSYLISYLVPVIVWKCVNVQWNFAWWQTQSHKSQPRLHWAIHTICIIFCGFWFLNLFHYNFKKCLQKVTSVEKLG